MGVIEVLLTHAGGPATRWLRLRPFRRLGEISYGLYLYHYPILLIILDLVRVSGLVGKHYEFRLLAILATIPVAAMSWRFVERPLLELKRRHPYEAFPRDRHDVRFDGPEPTFLQPGPKASEHSIHGTAVASIDESGGPRFTDVEAG
jgi:peptidoglycan/LPS O-acetylase OafA/YrhL